MKPVAIGILLALSVSFAAPLNVGAAAPIGKSQARCNSRVSGQLEGQVSDIQRHPPSDADLDKGFATLDRLIADLAQEDGVLEATCTTQDLVGLRGDIRSSEALAYLLESDLALRKFAMTCPAARDKYASGYVAAAWLSVQRAIPDVGTPEPTLETLTSQVRSRAQGVGLTLVPLSDASEYWVHQVQDVGRRAASACP